MATSDVTFRRQDDLIVAAIPRSKVIIAGSVGGACLICTTGLVFCMLVCRRWIRDKRSARRRQNGSRRAGTPSTVFSGRRTSTSSGGCSTLTSHAARHHSQLAHPVVLPTDELSLPFPPDALWRSPIGAQTRPYESPWSQSNIESAYGDSSHQLPVDISAFVGSSYFDPGTTTSWPLRLDSTPHGHPSSKFVSNELSSPTSSFADRRPSVTDDVIRGSREVATSDGRLSTHQSSASRNHVTNARVTSSRTESSMRNNHRSTDRKFSDSVLPENQRRRNADSSSADAPADRHTLELVSCQLPRRLVAVDGGSSSADTVVEGQRIFTDDWRRDDDDDDVVRHPVWIRRHVDENSLTTRCSGTSGRAMELYSSDGSGNVDDRTEIHRDAGLTKVVENRGYSFHQRSRTTRS